MSEVITKTELSTNLKLAREMEAYYEQRLKYWESQRLKLLTHILKNAQGTTKAPDDNTRG